MKNKIHHITAVLDASGSMVPHQHDLIKVMDTQIASLAADSRNHPGEETRVSVFMFSSPGFGHVDFECLLYDMDVLHVPSIAGMYRISGGTALCDAMVRVIGDLKMIPEKYGEHFHLLYLLTDGQELHSTPQGRQMLPGMIAGLPQNYTIAGFVPDAGGKYMLNRYGFPMGNISIWDPSQEGAALEAGVAMAAATTGYMSVTRSGTATSVQNLFEMKAPPAANLKKGLTPLTPGSYFFENVDAETLAQVQNGRIDQFMELKTGQPYFPGRAYYEMTQRVRIQPYKKIAVAVLDKSSNIEEVFMGDGVRAKLGLPDAGEVRISPGQWNAKGYKVFILSTSNNRKLLAGTRVLVMR